MTHKDKNIFLSTSYGGKESQVYNQLKFAITNHKYPSGTILSERKLGEEFNMSRTPIREALIKLTHQGLLKNIPGSGVVVPTYTIEDILEVYDLMELLQKHTIRSYIQKARQTSINNLGEILSNMENALLSKDIDSFVKFDNEFHSFFILNSSNKRLLGFYESLDSQSRQFKATVSEHISQAQRSFNEHKSLYNAVILKDMGHIEEILSTHYKNIKGYHIDKLLYGIN